MLLNPMNQDLQHILAVFEAQTKGLRISDIEQALPEPIPRRTLLRRLGTLKAMGKITAQGQKRGTIYYMAGQYENLPLSTSAIELKEQVQRPLVQRIPVAYQPGFLYAYQPNETFYLSELARKKLHEIGQQFNHELEPGTYAKRIMHRLLIDLSWNSSRLEGNTYSLLETEHLIEFGASAQGKHAFETQMVINHKEAIEFIVETVNEVGLTSYMILNIHALLSNNLLANPKARGYLRKIPVAIGKTVYHPPEIPQLVEECFQTILTTANNITDPFEQAFFLMVQLPYLQPFEDVNKRVSRIAANIPLIKHNLSPLSFIDVPKTDYINGLLAIYELNKIDLLRDVFIWAYERSAQQYQLVQNTLGDPNLLQMKFKKELTELIHRVVSNNLKGEMIIQTVQQWTKNNIAEEHQKQFIQIAEREIASLHEGNIAIYHIKPEIFARWMK